MNVKFHGSGGDQLREWQNLELLNKIDISLLDRPSGKLEVYSSCTMNKAIYAITDSGRQHGARPPYQVRLE